MPGQGLDRPLSRRTLIRGAAAWAAASLMGCTAPPDTEDPGTRSAGPTRAGTTSVPEPLVCEDVGAPSASAPLWERPIERGLVFGSSAATWQLEDTAYRALHAREASILFTEDDLLWYRVKPTPTAELDYSYADRIVDYAEREGMLVFGAHLVWDEGLGEGWTEDDLWALSEKEARELLFGTLETTVRRYRGRIAGWIVVNEVLDAFGVRSELPWNGTIGPGYVAEAFHLAHEIDPEATLVLNDFGYETDDDVSSAADKRAVTLDYLDELLDAGVPVQAFGIQAHLLAHRFPDGFDADAYRTFLAELAARGLRVLITEMDVLDDGLPPEPAIRDRGVADVYRTYLEVALDEPAVASLMTFGLSDRYTWLEEDFPREDGAPRRPLPFDEELEPKPAYRALAEALDAAPLRDALWVPPRC